MDEAKFQKRLKKTRSEIIKRNVAYQEGYDCGVEKGYRAGLAALEKPSCPDGIRRDRAECDCKDFKDNIKKIDGPIIMEALRYGTKGYDGEQFRFCPWCGKSLFIPPPTGGGD